MHGELPQELSVTALEVLGTGTGHAKGNTYKINHVSKLVDVKVLHDKLCYLGMNLGRCLHFLMVDDASRKGWLKNVSAGWRVRGTEQNFTNIKTWKYLKPKHKHIYQLMFKDILSCHHSPKSILSFWFLCSSPSSRSPSCGDVSLGMLGYKKTGSLIPCFYAYWL